MKPDANPMQSAHDAQRCAATSKRTGAPCRAPAVRGWRVCRMHGARGGAPEGEANGAWRHGERGREAAEARARLVRLVVMAKELMRGVGEGAFVDAHGARDRPRCRRHGARVG